MADLIGIVLVSAFLLGILVAAGKPLLHALRTGPVPPFSPGSAPLPGPPPGIGGDPSGVREPRQPTPSGAAGAIALDPDH
jgi:hypothetical protein